MVAPSGTTCCTNAETSPPTCKLLTGGSKAVALESSWFAICAG